MGPLWRLARAHGTFTASVPVEGVTSWGMPSRETKPGILGYEWVVTMHAEDDVPLDTQEAFAEHGGALFGFALNALGDRSEAEDCVQETFVRAWRNKERYSSSRGSVRTWLFAITRNLVIDALRARARRPTPIDQEKIEWASEPVTEDLQIVERLVLYESLATLTFEHREVIVAVQLDGISYLELSERTRVPVATLRTRMYYGMKSLRTALGGKTPNG